MGDYGDLHTRLRAKYGSPGPRLGLAATPLAGGGAVVEMAGRTVMAAPAVPIEAASWLPSDLAAKWGDMPERNDLILWLTGRYVEAERPNRNGAMWSTADLEHGLKSIAHGPLNWLHDERHVIGTLADAEIVRGGPDRAAAEPPYVATAMAVWTWVYPKQAAQLRDLAEAGRLYQSMECVAEAVRCAGDKGCGHEVDYFESFANPNAMCEHLRERSSARHLVNPTFIGSGIIVPPTRPGWGGASVELMRTAEVLAEAASDAGATVSDDFVDVVSGVLEAA